MAGSPNQKLKLLCLADILRKRTDETHAINMGEIIRLLEKNGVIAERKSIYRDIDVLREYGMKITKGEINRFGYQLLSNRIKTTDLMLITDALMASPLITQRKTEELTELLCSQSGDFQAEQLRRQLFGTSRSWPEGRRMLQGRIKTDNEDVHRNIATVHKAISSSKRIRFIYHHTQLVNNLPVTDTGREFVISPYAVVWNEDKCYVVGNYDKYDDLSHYRIDRMNHVECTTIPVRAIGEVSRYHGVIDTADYMRKVFNMYTGSESINIELDCDIKLLDTMIERFGFQASYRAVSTERFRVRAPVLLSDGLERWLLGFGSAVVVCSPESLRTRLRKRLGEMLAMYN